jgi:hypothetical protein
LADSQDCEGSKDPPQFNRMPGYYIDDYDEKEFDSVEFKIKTEKNAIIEGHCFRLEYSVKDDVKTADPVQIVRNYSNAVKNKGGQIVDSSADEATLKVATKTAETWVYVGVYNGGDLYKLTIVEKQLMQQDIVADAASLDQSIKNKGKASM